MQQMSDQELARVAAQGGRAAFNEIVRRYCRGLTLFAVGRTGTLQDAEDIVQETFLRAYRNIGTFNGAYSLKNWLFTIAYRLIVSYYRKKKPRRLTEEAAAQLVAEPSLSYENQWIWERARELGTEAYTVLWLRYKQEMTTGEIAGIMKKSPVMVRVLLHRSRKRLARQIATRPEEEEQAHWIREKCLLIERTK